MATNKNFKVNGDVICNSISVTSNVKITNLNAELLNGNPASYYTNANNISSGTLSIGRLPALSGDVISVAGNNYITLSNNGIISGTYGNSAYIPIITVDSKGRVSNVNPVHIETPENSLLFVGDVIGTGITGSNTTLTLANIISSGSAGSSSTIPVINFDSKGRITGTSNSNIVSASTGVAGIVQLNDTINSTSTSLAATANTVKTAYDLASTKLNSSGGTISGDLTVSGNFIVNGTTTSINTATLQVADNIIELRKGNLLVAADGGIQVNLTSDASGNITGSRSLKWNNSASAFQLTNDGTNYYNIATSNNKLSNFSNTTSSELAGIISDETGSGKLVFSDNSTLSNVNIDKINLNNGNITSNTVIINSNNVTVNVDSFPTLTYRSAQYLIQATKSGTSPQFNLTNLLIFHDGSGAFLTEYGQISNYGMLGDFDAIISGGNLILQYSNYGDATTNNISIKIIRTTITT